MIAAAPHPFAQLVMLLQWRAGLRISEALALVPGDLSLSGDPPTLRVRHGKGNKARIVPVHAELKGALAAKIAYGKATDKLVVAHPSTAWRWVKEAQAQAEFMGTIPRGRKIATHTLRHSAARHWLANGVPINQVSVWLGHASLNTTLIYLQIVPDAAGNMARVP